MGNKTVYISDENMQSWEDFKTVHGSLNNYLSNNVSRSVNSMAAATITTSSIPSTPVNNVCKHGYSPKMCKFAKNGKPCVEKTTPSQP